jgi:hypothetical protein
VRDPRYHSLTLSQSVTVVVHVPLSVAPSDGPSVPILDVFQGLRFEQALDLALELFVGEFAVGVALAQSRQGLVVGPLRVGASAARVGRVGVLACRLGRVVRQPLVFLLVEQDSDERDDDDLPEQHEREPVLEPGQHQRQPYPRHEQRGDPGGVFSCTLHGPRL